MWLCLFHATETVLRFYHVSLIQRCRRRCVVHFSYASHATTTGVESGGMDLPSMVLIFHSNTCEQNHFHASLQTAVSQYAQTAAMERVLSTRATTACTYVSSTCPSPPALVFFQIVFPQPGALGLNLRSYFAQNPAGARFGLPEYGSLVVLDCQNAWLKVRRCTRSVHYYSLKGHITGGCKARLFVFDLGQV